MASLYDTASAGFPAQFSQANPLRAMMSSVGGGGGGFSSGGGGTTDARSSTQTYYADPALAQNLSQSLGGLQQNLAGQYQGLLQDPTASPLYQGQLQGLLHSLLPSEAQARTSLADTFRNAGGLRSGAYGSSASQLEGDILGRRQDTAAKLLGQAFPQLMQALQNPLGQVSSLIDALKLSQGQGARTTTGGGGSSSGWENIPPSLGLNTPMASDRMGSTQTSPYGGGSAQVGVNSSPYGGTSTGGAPAASNAGSYDLLSRILGGGSGTTYNPVSGFYESAPSSNLGTFTPQQGGPSAIAPTAEYNPITGAYQGGYQSAPYVGGDYNTTGWEY